MFISLCLKDSLNYNGGGEFSHTLQGCHGGLNMIPLICKLMSFFTGLDHSARTIKVDILLLNPTKRKQKKKILHSKIEYNSRKHPIDARLAT